MSRNKYPEKTIEKILDVGTELFLTKGYDNTSMQDIIDKLQMTKGAIYHHFSSKEELLQQVLERYFKNDDWLIEIQQNKEANGLEKLRMIFFHELGNEKKIQMDHITKHTYQDSKVLVQELKTSIHTVAPLIAKLIEEGIADHSIESDNASELAEVMMILINVWINPFIFPVGEEKFEQKVGFTKTMLDRLGVPIITDELLGMTKKYYNSMQQDPN